VGNNTTASDGGLDESIELLVAADGELKMTRRNSLHLQVLASVASELKHLSGEVLEDSSGVDGRCCADTAV